MEKELIIHTVSNEVEIALLEDSKLVELHYQKTNNNFSVGDIFLGKIKKLNPSLNAAFVDIGYEKDAFLHYTDLGPKLNSVLSFTEGAMDGSINSSRLDNFTIEPDIIKNDKIDLVLSKRKAVLVQMLKEPISTKGPRLTCEINLPGRYMVLTPFSDLISISKKISDPDERKRLQVLAESIKPKNFGVIIRTAAEGKKVADLHEEIRGIVAKWDHIFKQMHDAILPVKLLSELDKTSSIIRDLLTDSFNKIIIDDKEMYYSIKAYLDSFAPDQQKIVQFFNSKKNIFDEHGVTHQIKASFGKTATLTSGAYLIIEHTEAMHVIDVNSGHKVSTIAQEESILRINLEAAEEIARQIRLRDIGGLIVIDFIDMRNPEHKRILMEKMKDFMIKDRAQHTILPLSKFGLMQITRERVRPQVVINTSEDCPACGGTGKINASVLLTDEIERDLEFIIHSKPKKSIYLHVHPYVASYLKKGFFSMHMKWYMKYKKWIKV
ncbi:MAG TPA: Rne/Rng family ribonuclease, partial [Saprospiraceae bacterium]|nr:Rne/Rng family ribonuclease [Saprospiraceae bacterium]